MQTSMGNTSESSRLHSCNKKALILSHVLRLLLLSIIPSHVLLCAFYPFDT